LRDGTITDAQRLNWVAESAERISAVREEWPNHPDIRAAIDHLIEGGA
jgi:hypothetical protein